MTTHTRAPNIHQQAHKEAAARRLLALHTVAEIARRFENRSEVQ